MSGLAPNTSNIQLVARPTSDVIWDRSHPEYQYWRPEWQKLRDVLSGQREIKRKTEIYLPRMNGADEEDYALYLRRATFYNMTGQTLNGMLGQVFRTDPALRRLPEKHRNAVKRFAKDSTGLFGFLKTIMSEQIAMGRFGVLVDVPPSVSRRTPQSYAVGYTTENIIDWTVEEVDGFYTPTKVLLREFVREQDFVAPPPKNETSAQARKRQIAQQKLRQAQARRVGPTISQTARSSWGYTYITLFRELALEPVYAADGETIVSRVYRQYLYKDDPYTAPIDFFEPQVRGKTLDFIPFMFFGAMSNSADVEKPPLLDICDLNLSHYLTYAELEWGRMYTALPVYYAPGSANETADVYHIGPSRVWEVPEGEAPGILEFAGQGLGALVTALESKERQIAAIGGRLMPGAKSVSESDNQTNMREINEQSLLLNIIQAAEIGITVVLRWWLMFRDLTLADSEDLRVEINQDFLRAPIGARELRAIQLMYADGVIPIQVVYDYLRKAQVVASDMEFADFEALLNDPNSFLNNPDIVARQRGFADRAQELGQATAAREADINERKVTAQEDQVEIEREKLEIARKVGSTSVAASRKLGDPEQADPSKADQGAIAAQHKQADVAEQNVALTGAMHKDDHALAKKTQVDQAKAAMKAASQPKIAPGSTKAKAKPGGSR
jgi:hypothetical protein